MTINIGVQIYLRASNKVIKIIHHITPCKDHIFCIRGAVAVIENVETGGEDYCQFADQ